VQTRHKNVDFCIIRDNLEGEYTGIEHEVYPGVFESLKIITKSKASRVAHYAFETAVLSGRKKVTAVHKANIMKMADGLFLECCREAASKFP
jgi:isocitrate dehydrogenase (NAD+)